MLPVTTPESQAVIAVRDFRVKLEALDAQTVESMASRWLSIEASLQSDIAALAEEMARRTAAGEVITKQMIWRAERYQVLQRQLETQISKYNNEAAATITAAQRRAATLGIDSAQAALFASYPTPLSASFNRVNVGAVESLVGISGDGKPLGNLLSKAVGDASNGIVDALVNGLGKGSGAFQIAKDMANGMGLGLDRSILIARTELNRSYRNSSVAQYRESGVVSGFYRLVNKATACIGCLMRDGEFLELESELECHPNGMCAAVPHVRGMGAPEWEKGKDWLLSQDEARQREILGDARFDLWQGGMSLDSFSGLSHSDIWGDAPMVVSLKDLVK